MSNRLFKVDLSDGARDFKPTATEPGLAMLDRNNANYSILRRWLGDYVAEPEWMGEDVHFFVREEARGRLDNVHCTPCTKADLLGPLQPQLEEIDQQLRKAKPETANEQLVHRIMRKQFGELTKDYDASDFHCHLFKYRQGSEPWQLIWGWGYQRTDVEPARSIICGSPECEALYARRVKQKARCPVCSSAATRGKKPPPPLWMRVAQLALLLLLLLGFAGFLGLLAMNQPRLVVTPDDWAGPPGSRVQYKVEHKRWLLWNDDVTEKVVPQSEDNRIVRFEPHGALAKARAPGNARLTFHYKDLSSAATAHVGQPKQPASIKLEPAGDVRLASGATKQVKLIGYYDEHEKLDPVDLSEMSQWSTEDSQIAFFAKPGICEGGSEGISNLAVKYRATEGDDWLDATAKAIVTKVDYQSIEVAVVPGIFDMQQSGAVEVNGIGADGQKYSLVGSSLLKLTVEPASVAKLEGDYLLGLSQGSGELSASFLNDEFNGKANFTVGASSLATGTFLVTPGDPKILVSESLNLDVLSASGEPIKTTSSDNEVVQVVGDRTLVGLKPGKAIVTLKQGGSIATVEVTVSQTNIATLHIDPPVITLLSGKPTPVRVYAVDKSGARIDVAPERITWVTQPPLNYAELDRSSMSLFGVTPTNEPWPLVAQLGENDQIQAQASVQVLSNSVVTVDIPEGFGAHPPVSVFNKTYAMNVGPSTGGVLYDSDRGLVIGDDIGPDSLFRASNLRPDYTIVSHNGRDLTGLSREELESHFLENPLRYSDRVGYRTTEGAGGLVKLGVTSVGVTYDIRVHRLTPRDVTPEYFSAELDLELRDAAEYRITNATGEELTQWQELGPTPLTTLTTAKIPRGDNDRYELFIERKIDEEVQQYSYKFSLTPGQL